MNSDETGTIPNLYYRFDNLPLVPVVLVAHAPPMTLKTDGAVIEGSSLEIGRGKECGFRIVENNISRRHIRITCDQDGNRIEELGSKNGTFVNGRRITGAVELEDQAVIRIGMAVLVFLTDGNRLFANTKTDKYGFKGRFYSGALMDRLLECILSDLNLLIVGPTGSGKELAANAVAKMMEKPIVIQNAARFATEGEAMSTLFGVGEKVFSDVRQKQGYIKMADAGVFFLDECHNLPEPVQKSLLRVIEDKEVAQIGETETKKVDVKFVFASNDPPPTYGLAKDLLARMRVFQLPPLKERLADIPSLFDHMLTKALERVGVQNPPLHKFVCANHYESLMLDGLESTNVRGLIEIADRVATRFASGTEMDQAGNEVFHERFGAQYAQYKDMGMGIGDRVTQEIQRTDAMHNRGPSAVKAAYQNQGGNVTAIRSELLKKGISHSRTTIAKILDELNLPRIVRKRKKKKKKKRR